MKLSIGTKFTVSNILLITIAAVLWGWFTVSQEQNALYEELNERAIALSQNLALNSVLGVMSLNTEELTRLAKSTLAQKDIFSIEIVDPNGKTLVKTSKEDRNITGYEIRTPIMREKKVLSANEEMLLGLATNEELIKIGEVLMTVTLDNMNRKIKGLIPKALILSIFIILFVVLANTLLFKIYINDPVRALISATLKISKGDLSHQVDIRSKDEIGALATFFNSMTKELKRSRADIEKYSQELEFKVEERTKALAASEERFRDVASSSADWLWEVDENAIYTFCSEKVVDILGYTREEIIGKSLMDLLAPEEVEPARKLLFSGGKIIPFRDYENINISKDGRRVCLLSSGVPIWDKGGRFKGYRGVDKDITQQKKAKEVQDKLQRQIMQSDKLAAIGQLAGGVAHELNNPIGIILGFAQSVVRRIKEDDPLQMPLNTISKEALRCRKLVSNLLTFSRSAKTERELMDVNTTTDEVILLIETQAKVNNVEIVKNYGANIPRTMGNKNEIQQVIINLCNNAIDAMPQGGRLTVSTSHNAPDHAIEITVRDTGTGIPSDILDKIFDPFFTTKEVGKGTGLGLSLCYEIIQKHSGNITLESVPGKGTLFKVIIPLAND